MPGTDAEQDLHASPADIEVGAEGVPGGVEGGLVLTGFLHTLHSGWPHLS